MTTNRSRRRWLTALALAAALLGGADVFAVIGRPLTPLSYAGVARRTTRRTVAVTAATRPVYPVPVAPHPAYAYPAPYPAYW